MESQFVQIQTMLGDREQQQQLRRSTPGPHCQLLEIDPHYCRGCEKNPQYRIPQGGEREHSRFNAEIHDTAQRMTLLDLGVTMTLDDMTEMESVMMAVAQTVRRQIEHERSIEPGSTREDRDRLRSIQQRAVREGRDA